MWPSAGGQYVWAAELAPKKYKALIVSLVRLFDRKLLRSAHTLFPTELVRCLDQYRRSLAGWYFLFDGGHRSNSILRGDNASVRHEKMARFPGTLLDIGLILAAMVSDALQMNVLIILIWVVVNIFYVKGIRWMNESSESTVGDLRASTLC